MPIDPQMQKVIDATLALGLPPLEKMSVAQARASFRERTAALGPFEEVAHVTEHRVPVEGGTIALRTYTPQGRAPFPALVFYHGGGWVIGDLYTHDGICRALANAAGSVVASVDYRLAPEFKYPVAAEDAYAAYVWLIEHAATLGVDATRVAVGGDSAGGNLATVVALMARDRGGPRPRFQALIYPVTERNFDTASYRDNADGYLLTREAMRWFWRHYLAREEDGRQPYASPLLARDLRGLPPAHFITAEYDPLRDEGEAYARRLCEAGVATTLTRYSGVVHGFFRLTRLVGAAQRALDETAAALREALA